MILSRKEMRLFFYSSIIAFSMRRKTIELDNNLLSHVRKPQKKISWQWKSKAAPTQHHIPHSSLLNNFTCSQTVANLVLQDLMDHLEMRFREVDQKQYEAMIQNKVEVVSSFISGCWDPIGAVFREAEVSPNVEEEPKPVGTDWICGGKVGQCEKKRGKSKHPSILGTDRKPVIKEQLPSKNTFRSDHSSKCLIRMPKELHFQPKRSLQALRFDSCHDNDGDENQIREKLLKTGESFGNLYRASLLKAQNVQKMTKSRNLQSSNEQFSYDYDGGAIPISKLSKRANNKINILNTTCKIAKDIQFSKKGISMRKGPYSNCKTQIEDISKENRGRRDDLYQLIKARKESVLEDSNNLRFLPSNDEDQLELRNRFDQIVKGRAVRIREILKN